MSFQGEFKANSVEELAQEAKDKGLYMVDHTNVEPLLLEYEEVIKSTDILINKVDEEKEPFKSKYEARKMLDEICNKLEANRTILQLEKKIDLIKKEFNYRIGNIRTITASISWDVEEPHGTERDGCHAMEIYFPGLWEYIVEVSPDVNSDDDDLPRLREVELDDKIKYLLSPFMSLSGNSTASSSGISHITLDIFATVLKCLNMLGILWNGRENPRRGMLYLNCVKELYLKSTIHKDDNKDKKGDGKNKIELIYTHTLFYLAQAYGNLGYSAMSANFCYQTLQRQLSVGISGDSLLEWVKNSVSLSDYYLSSANCVLNAHTLEVCEYLLSRYEEELCMTWADDGTNDAAAAAAAVESNSNNCTSTTTTGKDNVFTFDKVEKVGPGISAEATAVEREVIEKGKEAIRNQEKLTELKANIARRWIRMDIDNLRIASERYRNQLEGIDDPEAKELDKELLQVEVEMKNTMMNGGWFQISDDKISNDINKPTTTLLRPSEIDSGEKAKEIFKRSTLKLQTCKQYFVLDGFVSDHVHLLQEQSRLYQYLSYYEVETKRKLAMHNRRIESLRPLLDSLSRASFEGLHKTLSYELGEAFLTIHEMKFTKVRDGMNERNLKPSVLLKANEYVFQGITCFAHFTTMFGPQEGKSAPIPIDTATLNTKEGFEREFNRCEALTVRDIDHSFLTDEEVRPFLNCHFHVARLLARAIHPASKTPGDAVMGLAAGLRGYEWLVKMAPAICEMKNVNLEEVFGEEYQICKDFAELLLGKINRIVYQGESIQSAFI